MPLLSVIVPLYNDEIYVVENLRSIVGNAEHIDLEIIVVNDGSTDESLERAERYLATTKVQHRIFTTTNSGLSAARNFGLTKSSSKYVAFLDSDDFMAPLAYKTMVDLAEADGCDQVFARARIHDANTGETRAFFDYEVWRDIIGKHKVHSFRPLERPQVFLTQPKICTRIWRRKFLTGNALNFPEGRVFEDIGFHLISLSLNGRVGFVHEAGLCYRHGHEDRITSSKNRVRFDVIQNAREVLTPKILGNLQPTVRGHLVVSLMRMVLWCRMGLSIELKREFDQQVASLVDLMDRETIRQGYVIDPKVIRRILVSTIRLGGWMQRIRAASILGKTLLNKKTQTNPANDE